MRVVTFGEVMGRVAPPGFKRFAQALPGPMDVTFAGAEANVAASLAMWGVDVAFVTAVPQNPIADACVAALHTVGIDVSHIARVRGGRLGLYFVETGANQRGGSVVYDREGSAIMRADTGTFDWPAVMAHATWFHVTGITPSLSAAAAQSAVNAARAARAAGAAVSCDLNFRRKLWGWEPGVEPRDLAERTMRELLQHVDLVVANEEDAEQVLGIKAAGTDVEAGRLNTAGYVDVARQIVRQFPGVSRVAITLRESVSASHNNWGGMLYVAASDAAHFAPTDGTGAYSPYEIRSIVDRVGAGDSFAAGLIFALNTPGLDAPHLAVAYAAAASCLKHSILGDFNYSTRAEVEALVKGAGTGRVRR